MESALLTERTFCHRWQGKHRSDAIPGLPAAVWQANSGLVGRRWHCHGKSYAERIA